MIDEKIEINETHLEELRKELSSEFKEAFKIVISELVNTASIQSHVGAACGIDNRALCIEVLEEYVKENK